MNDAEQEQFCQEEGDEDANEDAEDGIGGYDEFGGVVALRIEEVDESEEHAGLQDEEQLRPELRGGLGECLFSMAGI